MTNATGSVKILAFDVFGTVVDWHGSIVREVQALGLGVDANAFALAWRAGYFPAMDRVRRGELGWTRIDDLHRMILDAVLVKFGITSLSPEAVADLNRAWHRLDPWPDTLAGLHRLRARHTLVTLSNGNLGLLANMAKRARLPWDLILSAEVFRHYKPDPETYLGVAQIFDVSPGETMLVAAHKEDLRAAAACGMRTAFVTRPMEYGSTKRLDVSPDPAFDHHATDFLDLASQLDC
jgi:2-haloacid dehalogenase